MVQIGNDWDALLADEFHSAYYAQLRRVLKQEYAEHEVYPPMEDIFNALRYTAYADVKAVLLGAGPLSRPRAGAGAVLFGAAGRAAAAQPAKHLHRAAARHGPARAALGLPDPLGQGGRAACSTPP